MPTTPTCECDTLGPLYCAAHGEDEPDEGDLDASGEGWEGFAEGWEG